MPKRERYLFVCTNRRPDGNPKGSCAQSGSEELLVAMKSAFVAKKLHVVARPCGSACLDVCWEGPVVAVMPDNVFLGRVSKEDIPAIVEAISTPGMSVQTHPALTAKVLAAAQFDDPALVQLGSKKGA
jgi:(2Fe-2S) ferredoxin